MGADTQPISPEEADRAFACLDSYERIIIAVSGGADSSALLHLLVEWGSRHASRAIGRRTAELIVATVDHQLRAQSAAEARRVADDARAGGIRHMTLRDSSPPPPGPFSQAWARDLRYRLLRAAARDGLPSKRLPGGTLGSRPLYPKAAIVTGHHLDDQSETVLMRLARGSGLDGLAGIRAVRPLDTRVDLVRPLLPFAKARLIATLAARGHSWIDDPSNTNPRFERVRVRGQRQALAAAGVEADAIGRSARRLARANDAIEVAVDSLFRHTGDRGAAIDLNAAGFARIDWDLLCQAMPELRLRALLRLLNGLGARDAPASLGQLEALTEDRGWPLPDGLTIHHCRFVGGGRGEGRPTVYLCPEAGRLPETCFGPASSVAWGPFLVEDVTATTRLDAKVRAIGADGLAGLDQSGWQRPAWARDLPKLLLEVQPAIYDRTGLVSAPTLGIARFAATVVLPLSSTGKRLMAVP